MKRQIGKPRSPCLALLCSTSLLLAAAGLAQGRSGDSAEPVQTAEQLLAPYGQKRFSPLLRRALATWIQVEQEYWRADYAAARRSLDALWRYAPPGDAKWGHAASRVREVFLGRYPCYYALRMLDVCVDWRLAAAEQAALQGQVATLTVVLVGRAKGRQPRSLEELEKGTGPEIVKRMAPELRQNPERILRQSLRLFRDYVRAMTGGRLSLALRIVPLAELELRVTTSAKGRRRSGLARGQLTRVWQALPPDVVRTSDWWWVIYPSHVPGDFAEFSRTEFVTGGMATGPRAGAPCFLCDDLWLLRKPPHLGRGRYTDLERRAYLPHWLEHEFFHHLFRSYPDFALEKDGHQWFDRKRWPADFVGRYEADYYHEALLKRLGAAAVPLHIKLRYVAPAKELFQKITARDLLGEYLRAPLQNDWHRGTIEKVAKDLLRWRNKAGRTWTLSFDREHAALLTGPGNPYAGKPSARRFDLELARDRDGRYLPRVIGFRFQGSLYRKL